MATIAERLALVEAELHTAAEETRRAYGAYQDADMRQTRLIDELRELRHQQRSLNERIATARRCLDDATQEVMASLVQHQDAEAEGRSDGTWETHMEACRRQDRAQASLDELENS